MRIEEVLGRLRSALRQTLPGATAQALMTPRPPRTWPAGFNPARIRHAAGLLLIVPHADDAHVVLTVRADTLRHPGQVSLPGGVVEPGETFEQAALREAHEEVAVIADEVEILGRLTPLDIPVSGFRLHPIVGSVARRPHLRPADGEVARILEPPVADLTATTAVQWRTLTRGEQRIIYPAFVLQETEVWGATAMVLAEFLVLLGWQGPTSD